MNLSHIKYKQRFDLIFMSCALPRRKKRLWSADPEVNKHKKEIRRQGNGMSLIR